MSRQKPPADPPPAMHLTIPRDKLEPALKLALGSADPKSEIEAYASLMLTALPASERSTGATGHLEVAATDGDAMMRMTVAAEVAAGGSVVVDAKTLRAAVKTLPEHGFVTLAAADDGARLVVTCDRARFRLEAIPPDDFPLIAISNIKSVIALPGTELARALALCTPAIGDGADGRTWLAGVFIHEDAAGGLSFVATDGHSLVRVALPRPDDFEGIGNGGVILPFRALKPIGTMAAAVAGEKVEIDLSDTLARFRAGPVAYTTKLIDGTFPDYTRVIPPARGHTRTLQVEAGALLVAIARARVVVEDKARAVRLSIDDEGVAVSARGTHGEASDTVEAALDGDPLVVGCNGTLLSDLVALVPASAEASIGLVDAMSPLTITAEAMPGVTMILMPMRIDAPAAAEGEAS